MKKVFLLLLILISPLSLAQLDGVWWNPEESGRGVTLETQNGIIVATLYGYDSDRIGRWYLAAGAVNDGVFNGTWRTYDGGQCSGCDLTAPHINEDQSEGAFTIVFHSDIRATMTWSGGTTPLQKFIYGYPTDLTYAYGLWTINTFYSSFSSNEVVVLDTYIDVDGVEYATGYVWGGTTDSQPVIARVLEYDETGRPVYTMLVDTSPSYYRMFIFTANKRNTTGLGWLYLKTSNPEGDGDLTLGAKFVEIANPASKSKTQVMTKENMNHLEFEHLQNQGVFNKSHNPVIQKMEEILARVKKQ